MRSWARTKGSVVGLAITSLVGGVLGGWLLLRTSDARFLRLLPWLMLAAALTFTLGGQLTARLCITVPPVLGRAGGVGGKDMPPWVFVFQLVIAAFTAATSAAAWGS